MKALVFALLLLAPAASRARSAIPDNRIEIGVIAGTGIEGGEEIERAGVVAASMAADDFGTAVGPIDVEIHGTPPDETGEALLSTVQHWLDDPHYGLIVDAAGSPIDARIASLAGKRDRLLVRVSPDTDPGTALCQGHALLWGQPPSVLATATARALSAAGKHRVFVIAAETGWGAAMLGGLTQRLGGALAGSTSVTEGAPDLGPALAQAAKSGADAAVLALSGPDLQIAWRQAREQGAANRFLMVAPGATQPEVDFAGEGAAAGTLIIGGWDERGSEDANHFAERFRERFRERRPVARDAEIFAAVYAYLEAAKEKRSIAAGAVLAALRAKPLDTVLGRVQLRSSGVAARAVPLFVVKPPEQVTDPADLFAPRGAIPAADAYGGACGGR